MLKLGVIGVGNMAGAILDRILESGVVPPEQVLLCDKHPNRHDALYKKGALYAENPCEVVERCEYVLLSIKPQGFGALLQELKPCCKGENVFISIAAGISGSFIKDTLGYDAKVVLGMPNTPVSLGYGTTALAPVSPTTDEEFATVMGFFAACGDAVQIAGNMMNEVIPFNGSGPAFIYRITQIFVERAKTLGFDKETALKLFCSTLIGSAHMMQDSGVELDDLIIKVCSKGGTTLAGLEAMEQNNLSQALVMGIDACVKRAYELGR